MLDLLVIGAGLAGLSAALTAAAEGLTVRVVAKGLGSMHWTAGTIDLLGYLPAQEAEAAGVQNPVADPFAAMARLDPAHPYSRLGPARVRTHLARLSESLDATQLGYASAPGGSNFLLPSPVGAGRPVWLAPAAQQAGHLADAGPLLIVGFTGLRDFYPQLIADNLGKQGHQARALQLPLDLLTPRRDSNTVQLAHALDDPRVRKRVIAALHRHMRNGERIGLPAVLGLENHAEALQEFRAELAVPVFEIPTLPPSVPGVRLHRALRHELMRRNVRVEAGMEVIGINVNGAGVASVETESSARPLKHRAHRYLLATGGLLGGGFNSDHTGRVWETIFGLPLTVPQQRAGWFRPLFLDPAGQPVFHGGIAVDAGYRPIDASGRPVYENLWAAGNGLAGADGIQERSLEGIAVVTGIGAAQAIATL